MAAPLVRRQLRAVGSAASSSLSAGSVVGRYEVVAPLAVGGMGEVYRAWDARLEREVAIKVLQPRLACDSRHLRQFVAEARAASALNHPNILTIYDAALDAVPPFIVSELLHGETLASELRRGAPLPSRALEYAAQIADALAEAHASGIVHRDLKPDNIVVLPTGRLKILDFGLARSAGSPSEGAAWVPVHDRTVTEAGLRAGTLPYMSPEQACGHVADFRSDQFSFGLILYEMVAGRPAFRRATPAETLDAIVYEEVPSIGCLTSPAAAMLAWVIERCLAKRPADRYGSTWDLCRDIRRLRELPTEARPPVISSAPRRRRSGHALMAEKAARLRPRWRGRN